MDYDDGEQDRRPALAASDPLPPEDWIGFEAHSRATALYAAHRPELTGFFRNRAPAQDVADLLQECFRRFFSNRSYPRVLLEEPRAYLFETARNLVAERHRRRGRALANDHHSFEDHAVAGTDPHEAIEARDQLRRVEQALAKLSPLTRTIFLLHRFDGLRYEEIAATQGVKVKRVEKEIAKAMLAIRRARARRP
jgi:RNA polymerase sigma-70 factor (ECF subfamily)